MQSMDISDWGDLRIFLAVVRGGSTLAASKALGVNQTTVSRRIDALEQKLGMALFDRDTRGFHPTAEGKALLDKSEAVEQAVSSFAKHAKTISRSTTGVIRVTAASATFDVFIAPFINAHLARDPHIQIDYVSSDCFLDLGAGEADIAFRATSRIDGDRLIVRRLPDFKWSVYCNRDYADNHGVPASAADLRNHKAIVFGGELENIIPQTWFAQQIDPVKIVARCNSLTNMRAAISNGIGVGVLACALAQFDPQLVRCMPPPPEMSDPFWIVIAPGAYRRPEVRKFVKHSAKTIPARMAELQGPADDFS